MEHQLLDRYAEIAPRRKFEAAGDRVPFDGGNDRLGEQHAGGPDRTVTVAVEATRTLHPPALASPSGRRRRRRCRSLR